MAVACMLTWYGSATLCTREGMTCVGGHGLSPQAIPSGQATHAKIDAHKLAGLGRGGMLPQASVYPTGT